MFLCLAKHIPELVLGNSHNVFRNLLNVFQNSLDMFDKPAAFDSEKVGRYMLHLLRKPGKHAKKLFPCMNSISSWLVDSINIHSSRNPAARFSLYYGDGSHIRAHLLFPWTFMSFVNVRRWKYGPIYFSWS